MPAVKLYVLASELASFVPAAVTATVFVVAGGVTGSTTGGTTGSTTGGTTGSTTGGTTGSTTDLRLVEQQGQQLVELYLRYPNQDFEYSHSQD